LNTHFPDYPFKANYLSLKGGKIHFIDEGQGPVIVLIHGNPTWSYYYRKLIAVLSKEYRIVAVDHMGCGRSDKPQRYPYSLKQHIDNLEHLLEHLEIDSFSLVMHDWGGAIGIGCGVNRPESVEKIVMMNSAAFRSSQIPLRISLCRMPVLGEVIVRLFNGFAWPAKFMAVENKMEKAVSDAYIAPYDSWANRVAIYNFVKDIPLKKTHPSYQELVKIENRLVCLSELKVPFLLLWGGKDFCFNDTFYEEWIRRFPEAENHYFKDAGHYILEDKFDEISPIISNFLGQRNH